MASFNDPEPKEDFNPYAAPAEYDVGQNDPDGPAAAIRKAHIGHEASIQSFGCLYYLGAIGMSLAGVIILVTTVGGGMPPGEETVFFVLVPIYIVLGALYFWIGSGLRSFNKVGRIGGTIFGVLGLLGFPIGTLISAYLLYLLWSKKGETVFSEGYKQVIQETPDVNYKTSAIAWIVLALFIGLILTVIIAALLGN